MTGLLWLVSNAGLMVRISDCCNRVFVILLANIKASQRNLL